MRLSCALRYKLLSQQDRSLILIRDLDQGKRLPLRPRAGPRAPVKSRLNS